MKVIRQIDDEELALSSSVVTMGNFDGIHLGHQALLRNTVEEARTSDRRSVVLTFEPHPLKILAPDRAPQLLLSYEDKLQMIESFGVDIAVVQTFDTRFAAVEPEEFVEKFLVQRLHVGKIWVGRDLRFGRRRRGGVDELIRWGAELGFQVGIVEPILLDGVRISSSHIRDLIEQGCVDDVRPFLGRFHFVSGEVVSGHRRGRALGFPTANIRTRTEVLPPHGIYATLFQFQERQWLSITSIGTNPTFGAGPPTVEAFILDFAADIYGASVKLFFVKRLRAEQKFATPELLIEQMKQDVTAAQEVFRQLSLEDPVGTIQSAFNVNSPDVRR
jgi:riboflavin kinase/FMN adenylyltransferase